MRKKRKGDEKERRVAGTGARSVTVGARAPAHFSTELRRVRDLWKQRTGGRHTGCAQHPCRVSPRGDSVER